MSDRHPPINSGTSILAIGDTHCATGDPWGIPVANCASDVNHMMGRIDAIVQMGDQTTFATNAEFNMYLAWRDSITRDVPFYEIPGNHDLIGNNASGTPDLKTPAQWATIVGASAPDRYVDINEIRLVLLSPTQDPSSHQWRLTIDSDQVDWLDTVLDTTQKCVIFFHAPWPETVGPFNGTAFSSFDTRWVMHDDPLNPVADVIEKHGTVVAWVGAHSHSRVTEEGVVTKVTLGSTSFAHVAVGSPAFRNPQTPRGHSTLLTFEDDAVEVRFRDHGHRQWLAPVHRVEL